jgi:hypothetical protein
LGFLRVGLGDGLASVASAGAAESVGAAEDVVDGEADVPDGLGLGAVSVAEADGTGTDGVGADGAAEDVVDGSEVDGDVAPAVPSAGDDGGEPAGVAVHPASTPAHSRALRAITERLTTTG